MESFKPKPKLYRIKRAVWKAFVEKAGLPKNAPVPKASIAMGGVEPGIRGKGFVLAAVGRYWLEDEVTEVIK